MKCIQYETDNDAKEKLGPGIENVKTVGCNFMKGTDRRNSEKVTR